jgi:molecular chaperone DnaK (HSP70)
VPSEVAYLPEGLRWGSQIPPHQPRQMWTKLELDQRPNGEAAKIVQELTSAASGLRKQPVDIVADFLAQVKTHLMENLDERFGKYLWRTLPITLVITMPAVWSDAAKARTREAIDKAGFNSLSFPQIRNIMVTTEPEAAAIYTIQTMRGTVQDQGLIAKDGFVVCDMGGGTVDLISYEVVKLHPIRVREATVGNGAQCGGTFVDRAFLQWLERRLGTSNFATITNDCRSEDLPRTSLAPKVAKLLQDFTMDAKSGFSGTETNYLQLPKPLCNLADSTSKGIFDGELKITP